jgi:glycosyltransferase involved in cell wall biosynthesis
MATDVDATGVDRTVEVDDPRVIFRNWPRRADESPIADVLVTVVVPVYNDEEYISHAIESVLGQSHKNFVVNIVDNKSNDRTPYIIDEYARRDSRVRHHRHEEFVGANENHSRAFSTVGEESDFCKVVQADDFLYPDCLEHMLLLAHRYPTVGVVTSYRRFEAGVDMVALPLSRETASGKEFLRRCFLEGPHFLGAPTASLLRADLVRARQPFYDPSFSHADTEALYSLLSQADFGHVHQVLTYSRSREGRLQFVQDAYCWAPEVVRMLLRHASFALTDAEIQGRLRAELAHYFRFLTRQRVLRRRRGDPDFHAYHSMQLDLIEAEAESRPAVQRMVRVLRALVDTREAAGRELDYF